MAARIISEEFQVERTGRWRHEVRMQNSVCGTTGHSALEYWARQGLQVRGDTREVSGEEVMAE